MQEKKMGSAQDAIAYGQPLYTPHKPVIGQ